MLRSAPAALVTLALLGGLGCTGNPTPPPGPCRRHEEIDDAPAPPLFTPRWAFEPWISKDISSTEDTRDFVAGFAERDIPVGVVVLDSPWETQYNTFVPSPMRYPEFGALVSELRSEDIRVVLWITQMVNRISLDLEPGGDFYTGPSPNYEEGLACGLFVNDGAEYGWWKGVGGALDFFDPDARGWWHRQQDPLFELGVSGFKLDFGESYITSPTIDTYEGERSLQEYSERYYEDFYAYGAAKVGTTEFVTMVRPWDESYSFEGRFHARPEHAPVAWVGDNRRDFVGLADALDHMFRSAAAGYGAVGSDIGGYLDVDDKDFTTAIPFSTLVFQRWTAVGALSPFMQLHGRANITPWTVPDAPEETAAIYRYWASLHHELVPFFFSLAEEARSSGAPPILRPLGDEASWAGDYRYTLGDALLVAPVLDESGFRKVKLPEGRWHDWWSPDEAPFDGGSTVGYDAGDPQKVPLFVKDGAILPLFDAGPATGLGSEASRGLTTVLAYPGTEPTSFALHEDDGKVTNLGAAQGEVTLSRVRATTYLRVRVEPRPMTVSVNGEVLAELTDRAALDQAATGWFYRASERAVFAKLRAGDATTLSWAY